MIEIVVHAVGYGAIVEQRGIHLVHAGHQMLLAAHVQESLLLSGEGGLRQIFGRGGGADRDRELAAHRRRALPMARQDVENFLVAAASGKGVASIQPRICAPTTASRSTSSTSRAARCAADALVQPVLREKIAIRVRRRRESAGHRDTESRQRRNHLADRSVLAADELDVFILQLLERNDVGLHSALLVGRWVK